MTSLLDWKPNFDTHVIKIAESKVPYKYRNVINNLRRNKQLVILKQDKGRRVVLLDKTTYVQKCFSIINRNKFKKLDKNPTVSYEAKIQRTSRKMKSRFTLQEYNKAKHVAKILSTLSKSEYTVQNTNDFVNFIKP